MKKVIIVIICLIIFGNLPVGAKECDKVRLEATVIYNVLTKQQAHDRAELIKKQNSTACHVYIKTKDLCKKKVVSNSTVNSVVTPSNNPVQNKNDLTVGEKENIPVLYINENSFLLLPNRNGKNYINQEKSLRLNNNIYSEDKKDSDNKIKPDDKPIPPNDDKKKYHKKHRKHKHHVKYHDKKKDCNYKNHDKKKHDKKKDCNYKDHKKDKNNCNIKGNFHDHIKGNFHDHINGRNKNDHGDKNGNCKSKGNNLGNKSGNKAHGNNNGKQNGHKGHNGHNGNHGVGHGKR